jgi:hypothetical protein
MLVVVMVGWAIRFAYCYVQRLYVYEWECDLLEAAQLLLSLSQVVSQNATYNTALEALHASQRISLLPPFRNPRIFSIRVLHDVQCIMRSKHYCLAALQHVHTLLSHASKVLRDAAPKCGAAQRKQQSARVQAGIRKLHYFMVWLNEFHNQQVFEACAEYIEREQQEQLQLQKQQQATIESSREQAVLVDQQRRHE